MPIVTPDFSEVVPQAPNLPGSYLCEIKSSEVKMAQSGAKYMSWKLELTDEKGRRKPLFYNTPLSGRGAGMFKHMMHAAGDINYVNGPADTDKLVGRYVWMKLDVDKDSGYFIVKRVDRPTELQLQQAISF